MAYFYNKQYITELNIGGKKNTDDNNDDEFEMDEPPTQDNDTEGGDDNTDNNDEGEVNNDDNEFEMDNPPTSNDQSDQPNDGGGVEDTPVQDDGGETGETNTTSTGSEEPNNGEEEGLEEPDSSDDDIEGGDDNTDNETPPENDSTSEENIKAMEDEIFSSLSEPQKLIKISELKGSFSRLYRSCDDILTNIDNIPKSDENLLVLERVTNTLTDLKVYIEHYLMYVFDTKTYTENEANLQKYISIFNAVNEIFKEIAKQKAKI